MRSGVPPPARKGVSGIGNQTPLPNLLQVRFILDAPYPLCDGTESHHGSRWADGEVDETYVGGKVQRTARQPAQGSGNQALAAKAGCRIGNRQRDGNVHRRVIAM